jgi:hypothetical protein
MTSMGNDDAWPLCEETVAICEGCGEAISPYQTSKGWVFRHRATRRLTCVVPSLTVAHVNGTWRVPGYED